MEEIGELSVGVVTPNEDVVDIGDVHASLLGDLVTGSVVIEASKSAEVLLGDGGSAGGRNEAVGVGGVADNKDFGRLLGNLVQNLSLFREDGGILLNQILSFHALKTRESTNKDDVVNLSESLTSIRSNEDA
jgi:hypothetical protein